MRNLKLLIVCFCGLLMNQQAKAQVDTLDIQEILINSTRAGEVELKSSRTVEIITREQIAQTPAQTIEEVLETALAVDIRTRGQGTQADISLRGGSFEQTLIMVNGIPMTDPQTGHHAFNIPISLDDVKRIEVYPGGSSSIFGPKAFSGAINIITNDDTSDHIKLNTAVGDFGLVQSRLSVNGSIDKFTLNASGGINSSNGYIRNTDFRNYHVNATATYRSKNIKASLFAGMMDRAFGAQNFYTANFPDQFEQIKTQLVSADVQYQKDNITIKSKSYYRQLNDRFELFREDPGWYQYSNGIYVSLNDTAPFWYGGHNYHKTDVVGTSLSATYQKGIHQLTIGGDYRFEKVVSNVLGEELDTPIKIDGESDKFYTNGTDRSEFSLFIEEKITLQKFIITGGLHASFHSVYDERLSPGLKVSFLATENVTFYVNGGTSFRFPTFTDLYYNLGGAVGSIDLKPETAVNFEIGARAQRKNFQSQLAFFRRDAKNVIDWIRYNGSNITEAANITEVSFTGMDLSLGYNVPNEDLKSTGISYVGINYSLIGSDTTSKEFESNYALDYLKNKISGIVTVRLFEKLSLNTTVSYQQREGGYIEPGMITETPYSDFILVDMKLSLNYSKSSLYLSCSNIFDTDYRDFGNIEQPGRWIKGGVSIMLTND